MKHSSSNATSERELSLHCAIEGDGGSHVDKVVFLHEWRRHVCRDCTGHLALRIIELLARKEEPGKTSRNNQTPNQKPNKTKETDFLAAHNSKGSCKGETKKKR